MTIELYKFKSFFKFVKSIKLYFYKPE